jgi:hypothetical protein
VPPGRAENWRDTTVDVDLKLDPEPTGIFEALRTLKDSNDVQQMIARGLVDPSQLLELFRRVEPEFLRYPGIELGLLRAKLESLVLGGPP